MKITFYQPSPCLHGMWIATEITYEIKRIDSDYFMESRET
jgi:hypothetical protein